MTGILPVVSWPSS